MSLFDIDAFLRHYPDHEHAIRQCHERCMTALAAHLQKGEFYCAQSKAVREQFSLPFYESIGKLLYGESSILEEDMEDANARLGVSVDSQTQAGLVKVVSALNVCKKCLASGASESESRNVTSRMRFTRSWDEPGIEVLTCQRCGHVWKR